MRMKRLRGPAVAAVLVLAASACSPSSSAGGGASRSAAAGQPQRGGTLHVTRSESFDGWDMDKAAAYASYQTLYAVLEPLVRFSADGKDLEPGIAKSWTYDPARKTWTFVLRSGVTFSDGTPLTSADVAFSEKVWAAGPNFGSLYAGITKVETPDPSTVVFDVAEPFTTLPVQMAWSSSGIVPANYGGRTQKRSTRRRSVPAPSPSCRGAPAARSCWPATRTTTRPVALPRQGRDRRRGRLERASRALPVRAGGHLRVRLLVDGPAVRQGRPRAPVEPGRAPEPERHQGAVRQPQGAAGDRRGDRLQGHRRRPVPGLRHDAAGDPARPTSATTPHRPAVPAPTQDVAKARQLLAGAGGRPRGSYEVIYDSGQPNDALVAQILQQNLAAIGIKLKLTGLETGRLPRRRLRASSPTLSCGRTARSRPDMFDPIGWVLGTSWLFTGPDKGAGGAVRRLQRRTTDAAKQAIVTQIQDDRTAERPGAPARPTSRCCRAVAPR